MLNLIKLRVLNEEIHISPRYLAEIIFTKFPYSWSHIYAKLKCYYRCHKVYIG